MNTFMWLAATLVGLLPCVLGFSTPQLSISPGTASQPALGEFVELTVVCGDACPPYVQVGRVDGTRDPILFQPEWGPVPFDFGGNPDNRPVPVYGFGVSAAVNGTRLTPNSTAVTVYYDPAFEAAAFDLVPAGVRPGTVTLTVRQLNTTLPRFTTCSFNRYAVSSAPGVSPPEFSAQFYAHQESHTGSITLAFQQSGYYFYGATPAYMGRAGLCTAGGCDDGHPSPAPVAIAVAGPDGVVNGSLPSGFQGTVFHAPPLASPHALCVIQPNVTLFSGGRINLPLCRPVPSVEIPAQPPFFTIVAPQWLTVAGLSNQTSPFPADVVSVQPGTNGTQSVTLQTVHRWATYNNYVPLYTAFPSERVGMVVDAKVAVHMSATPPPETAFQPLTFHLVAAPNVALPATSRLVTSITWSDASMLAHGVVGGEEFVFTETYRNLGFNTVPHVSVGGALKSTAPPYLAADVYPGNRTGPAWQDLKFGPELSGFGGTFSTMLRTAPNATTLANMGVPSANIAEEMTKWENAVAFHNATHEVDVAYDGVWFQNDVAEYCDVAATILPEWFFADDEGWGEGWTMWRHTVTQSTNAQARRLPGETSLQLAARMALELFTVWTSCLPKGTTLAYYGTNFPDYVFHGAGVVAQPSVYGPIHYPTTYPDGIRSARLSRAQGEPLLPWITGCTYGQMTTLDTFNTALHTFSSGATGFSYFIESCLDDMGKLLALSTATSVAHSVEDVVVDGLPLVPAIDAATTTSVLVWSGMALNGTAFVVVTPTGSPQDSVKFSLTLSSFKAVAGCVITSGNALQVAATASGAEVSGISRGGVALPMLLSSSPTQCTPLPGNAWVPAAM